MIVEPAAGGTSRPEDNLKPDRSAPFPYGLLDPFCSPPAPHCPQPVRMTGWHWGTTGPRPRPSRERWSHRRPGFTRFSG